MEGNFLSRFNNKIDHWKSMIVEDPANKRSYEQEMSQYIIQCMPYMNQHSDEALETTTSSDNPLNVKETTGLAKKDIFMDYLAEVEKQNIDRPRARKNADTCEQCSTSNVVFIPETSEMVCDSCGVVIDKIISEQLTYKEEQETSKIVSYSYKRENHFSEWLSQFQALETTTIPDDVIDKLRAELKKMKIKTVDEITAKVVRSLLKKLRLNKYYEHTMYITNILNGIEAPKMPHDLEERLRMMFRDIQQPFNDHCPKGRKNFLSYSYVLYKFCELLGEDQYLEYFPLLKSREKLYQQDLMWEKICGTLRWEYIPTV